MLEAINAGDAETTELLIKRGADAKIAGETGVTMAITTKCARCLELLAASITDKSVYTGSLQDTAVLADIRSVRFLLDHGADVNAFDLFGRTPLMYAAAADTLPVDVVQLLIDRGADVNAVNRHTKAGDAGLTVLDIAKHNGNTAVVQLLEKHGAKASALMPVDLHFKHDNDVRRAIQDSIPHLQRADTSFVTNSGCVSCHNNSLTAMTMGLSRKRGFTIDEKSDVVQVQANMDILAKLRDRMHQGFILSVEDNFTEGIVAYQLMGLAAEGYKSDLTTDAVAMYVLGRQHREGNWPEPHADNRPPLCLDYIGTTARSMRALQLYSPRVDAEKYRKAIDLAAHWLADSHSYNNDDRSWRLAGLAWAGRNKTATQQAMKELLATQHADGGWSDLPTMESTAYATGKSLVALQIAGLSVSDQAYQRGSEFLLKTQQEDGTWYVATRALAFQPWSDSGFPHNYNQFISAAGTNWAAMALALTLPESGSTNASKPKSAPPAYPKKSKQQGVTTASLH